jgi:daunorubicin resistance ABC transporter ATP-binding subunit
MVTEAAIRLRGLTKRFEEVVAVDHVDLEIPKGEIFGLLGPNGAGKTTIIRLLGGLSVPSEGSASVQGLDIVRDTKAVKSHIGVVPQKNVLDRDINVRRNLVYHAKLHMMPKSSIMPKVDEVLSFTELTSKRDADVDDLSGGMKRRLVVAMAMMHDPEVLFLDEPTTGLDPQSRRMVWDKIRSLRGRGITIVLTTHYMDEAEMLCDRVGIIDHGRVIALGTPSELKARLGKETVVVARVKGDERDPVLAEMASQPFAVECHGEGDQVMVRTRDKKAVAVALLRDHADAIETIEVREPTLEDVVISLTGRELRE